MLGRRAQCLEMLEFILLIVLGCKSFLWSKLDRVIFELGKVSLAFSMTALRESDTLSSWLCRSLVPVWIMWLGWDSVRSSRALSVVRYQNLTALCRGKSFFISINVPFESMSRATSGSSVLGCCETRADAVVLESLTGRCGGCELSGSGLSESALRGGC